MQEPINKEQDSLSNVYDFTEYKLKKLIDECFEKNDPNCNIYQTIYNLYTLEGIDIEWVGGEPMVNSEKLEKWYNTPYDPLF
jgi:hypothetical protein